MTRTARAAAALFLALMVLPFAAAEEEGEGSEGFAVAALAALVVTGVTAAWNLVRRKWLLGWLRGRKRAIKGVMDVHRRLIQPVHAVAGVVTLATGIVHGVLAEGQHWVLWLSMAGFGFLTLGGTLLQWKYTPAKVRKGVYLLHAQQLFFLTTVGLLLLGHALVGE